MSTFNARQASLEALESRVLFSANVQVTGYLVDYQIANSANTAFSENANGTIAHDNLDWSALTQVNYFSLLPNLKSGSTAQNARSSGAIQPMTDSGYDIQSVQLPALVADAKSHGASVFVTIGGGDANAILDMDALVNTPSAYSTFAANVKAFCNKYGLAGIDMDWEPTGQAGFTVTKAQINDYGKLLQAIKTADPKLKLTAEALGDAVAISKTSGAPTGKTAFMLNATAVKYVDGINVEAYPMVSESQAESIMQSWGDYLGGGKDLDGNTVSAPLAKLQYGIDVSSDDISNQPAGVVEEKVDTTLSQGYGGLFVFELDSDTADPSALSRIQTELSVDTSGTDNTVGATVTDKKGNPIAGVTIYLDANNNSTLDPSELSAVTDSNGEYSLFNVPAGNYMIRQILLPGDKQITPRKNEDICISLCSCTLSIGDDFTDSVPMTSY